MTELNKEILCALREMVAHRTSNVSNLQQSENFQEKKNSAGSL